MSLAKRYIFGIMVTGYLFLFAIVVLNYVIDPFEAAGSGFIKPVQHLINLPIVKTRALDANHGSFNGYIMGSSRSNEIEPHIVESYVPDSNFFNLSFNKASVAAQLRILNYMMNQRHPINHLLIQLDIPDGPYEKQVDVRDPLAPMLMLPPYLYPHEPRYYLSFIKVFYLNLRLDKLLEKFALRNIAGPEIYFGTTGVANWVKYKKDMADNPEAYVRAHVKPTKRPHRHLGKMSDLNGNISGIKNYLAFCRLHRINCVFFTPPINQNNLNEWNVKYYLAYLKSLANQTNFWSFSDYNSITTNDYLYVDPIHYHHKIIPVIFARIFENPDVAVPKDFGHFITSENVDDYLAKLRSQFMAADKTNSQ